MASRSLVSRIVRKQIATPVPRRYVQSTARRLHPELAQTKKFPVISYHDGERTQSEITVHEPRAASSVAVDVRREALALLPETLSKLTPTMKKFTLAGKIAVVTG